MIVTPDNPGKPDESINPNDPDGPKWPENTGKDSLEKTGTQTIKYIGAGSDTPKEITDHTTFTRHYVVDKVTGKILNPNESWTPAEHTFKSYKTPVVKGYVANVKEAGGFESTPTDPNKTYTVTYKKIGKIIPVDKDGNPIPGAATPEYKNDPNDPTKVIVTNTPGVEGYTATQKSVDPKDPVKDTKVKYTKNLSQIPDNPHDYGDDAGGKANDNLYDGDKDHKKKPAEKAKIKKPQQGPAKQAARGGNGPAKQVANNAPTTTAKANVPVQKASAPADHIVQAATISPAKHAAEAKTLPQTGSKNNNLAILGVSAMLASATMATMLYEAKRKRKA